MSNQIQQFFNQSLSINLRATDRTGTVWFVAKDVADALGYENPSKAYKICKSLNSLNTTDLGVLNKNNDLAPATKWINESDFYRLAFRSTKPIANLMADWVADDVLPSIRKTGSYSLSPTSPVSRVTYNEVVAENAALKIELDSVKTRYILCMEQHVSLLSLPKPIPLVRGFFSKEEDTIIIENRRKGRGAITISRILNRTAASTRYRMRYLEQFYDTRMASNNVDMFDGEVA